MQMQKGLWQEVTQTELAPRSARVPEAVLRVRPKADAELEASFVRAAEAWARWRERQTWRGGRRGTVRPRAA